MFIGISKHIDAMGIFLKLLFAMLLYKNRYQSLLKEIENTTSSREVVKKLNSLIRKFSDSDIHLISQSEKMWIFTSALVDVKYLPSKIILTFEGFKEVIVRPF